MEGLVHPPAVCSRGLHLLNRPPGRYPPTLTTSWSVPSPPGALTAQTAALHLQYSVAQRTVAAFRCRTQGPF